MTRSMTGFASRDGTGAGWSWSWDLRSVNGRGLDMRLRLPDWIDGLEAPVRAALPKVAKRGNITLSLRITRLTDSATPGIDPAALSRAVAMVAEAERAAGEAGLPLAQTTAGDLLSMRGVLDQAQGEVDPAPLREALLEDLDPLLAAFSEMREAEGAALEDVLSRQIDAIEADTGRAKDLQQARADHMASAMRDALTRVLENADGADGDRVAQELALIAVKADVAEELDRLTAHVAAARDLLAGEGPKGRKLDFLTQEFNREANTLCSKAQFAELTRVGLDLKHTIDQMREQVQNVE